MPQLQSALWFFDQGQKLDMFPDKTESRSSACAGRPSYKKATFRETLNYPPLLIPKSFRRSFMTWEWYVLGCYAVKNVPNQVCEILDFKGLLHESFDFHLVESGEVVCSRVSAGHENLDLREFLPDQ